MEISKCKYAKENDVCEILKNEINWETGTQGKYHKEAQEIRKHPLANIKVDIKGRGTSKCAFQTNMKSCPFYIISSK